MAIEVKVATEILERRQGHCTIIPVMNLSLTKKKKCVGGRFIVHYHERGWTMLGSVRSNLLLGGNDNNGEEHIAEGQ